jgi:hypothetical protein
VQSQIALQHLAGHPIDLSQLALGLIVAVAG